jgi:hypothetical protein
MLSLTASFSWTDTNNKKQHIVGTFSGTGDYPRGGDGLDLSRIVGPGYNTCIHFVVDGFVDYGSLGGSSLQYTCKPHLGNVPSVPGTGNRVAFFDGQVELGGPNLTTPYPADITANAWQFRAVYHKS